jgi:hypothetical protein
VITLTADSGNSRYCCLSGACRARSDSPSMLRP